MFHRPHLLSQCYFLYVPICSSSSDALVVCHGCYTPSSRAKPEVTVTSYLCNESHPAKAGARDEASEGLNWSSCNCPETGNGESAPVQGSITTCSWGFKSRESKTRRLQMNKYPVRRREQRNTKTHKESASIQKHTC